MSAKRFLFKDIIDDLKKKKEKTSKKAAPKEPTPPPIETCLSDSDSDVLLLSGSGQPAGPPNSPVSPL